MISSAWILAVLVACATPFTLAQTESGFDDDVVDNTNQIDPGQMGHSSSENRDLSNLVSGSGSSPSFDDTIGAAGGDGAGISDSNSVGPDEPPPSSTVVQQSMQASAPRKIDENAPAQKAEVAGIVLIMGADDRDHKGEILIIINEFKKSTIVRQSVCYDYYTPIQYKTRFQVPCYEMSDYDMVSGAFETLTTEQYYSLRNRMEEMLRNKNRARQTMIASYLAPKQGRPRTLRFFGQGWKSHLINMDLNNWFEATSPGFPTDGTQIVWSPPYEKSRAIRPYFWDEPKPIDSEGNDRD